MGGGSLRTLATAKSPAEDTRVAGSSQKAAGEGAFLLPGNPANQRPGSPAGTLPCLLEPGLEVPSDPEPRAGHALDELTPGGREEAGFRDGGTGGC